MENLFRARRVEDGFTLIELVAVLAIVAVLSTMAVPLLELNVQRSRERELRSSLREIRHAIDSYKSAWDEGRIEKGARDSGYPRRLAELVEGVEDQKDANRRKIYFLRRLPRDPLHPDTAIPAADTWGKRSYASPPDAPLEGEDVFDIYSRATGNGLNGRPYREW